MKTNLETILIQVQGQERLVAKDDYVRAMLKGLREFGYSNLTEDEIRIQLGKILAGQELNVIGLIMENDIIKDKSAPNPAKAA